MTHRDFIAALLENQDLAYRDFNMALIPNVPKETSIGVRIPVLRKLTKEFYWTASKKEICRFMDSIPHKYFEENQAHMILIESLDNFDECATRLEQFLPYVDNWSVCDGKNPKILLTDIPEFENRIQSWILSDTTYKVRFAVNILIMHFLDTRFDKKYLEWVKDCSRQSAIDYYVQMSIAWFFATALAKQWDATIPYIKERKLPQWIHNKTIQKACESYRILNERKNLLVKLKMP